MKTQLKEVQTPFGYKVKVGALKNIGVHKFNSSTSNSDIEHSEPLK